MQKVKLAAHRGYSSAYPENTMLAFKEALKLDIDMLEIDLHMTKDGEIVMMHDSAVDRTTDGTGFVKDKTLDEIRLLDAGIRKDLKFKGERVPLFKEFLELLKGFPDTEVNVEMKDYPEERGKDAFISCDRIISLLEEYGMADRIYINCWSGEILEYIFKKYGGKYRLHGYFPARLMFGDYDRETIYNKLFCACIFDVKNETGGWTDMHVKENYDYLKSIGVEPWVCFNPDTIENDKRAFENGALGFTCNDPLLAGKILDVIGARKLK